MPMTERQPKLPPGELTEEQRVLYDTITGGPRGQGKQVFALTDESGALRGPFNAMLLHPPLGSALQALGSAVRYQGKLTGRAREIAILVVARHWRSAFEAHSHEAIGASIGLTDDELAALREDRPFGDGHDRLVAATASALAARGDLTDEEFAAARDALGSAVVFELTTLVGYYATLAMQLRVFQVDPPN
jgi:4-carboxymuconolactone decarboxylase